MENKIYQFEHFGMSEFAKKEEGNNLNFPGHLHQSFEFFTVTSGVMEIVCDNRHYSLKSGDCLLIFPNQVHSITSSASSHKLWIFSTELVKAFTSKTAGKVPACNTFTPNRHILQSIEEINENSSIIEKKGVFYSLCASFDKNAVYETRAEDDKNLLFRIFAFVEANYNGNCTLESLAKETGFSYSYLSRYFKKIVGTSYNKYVNQYRISKACYLLINSDCTILQCALDCGYDSLRSFNRNFAECVSVTPSVYRNSHI